MVKHRDSGSEVCKGSTLTDQLNALVDDRGPSAGKVETIYTDQGFAMQMYTQLPHFPQYGDKEFPHSRVASSLVTRQHEGEKLTADQQKELAGYRQFPNSESLGYLAGLQKQGKMTPELAADFMAQKREAGCIKPAKVTGDGSIEFHH